MMGCFRGRPGPFALGKGIVQENLVALDDNRVPHLVQALLLRRFPVIKAVTLDVLLVLLLAYHVGVVCFRWA